MNKWILVSGVFILSLAITVFIGFYTAIFLIGPHSDILPEILYIPLGILLLILVVGIPIWLGRKAFVKLNHKENK